MDWFLLSYGVAARLMEKKQRDRPQLLLAGKKQPARIVSVE